MLRGSGERLAAAAARLGVRVLEGEAGALERDDEVDRRALEIFEALVIDEHAHALTLDHGVLRLAAADEAHIVFEPGAAAGFDHDPEAVDRLVGGGDRKSVV